MSKLLRDYVTINEKYFSLFREYEKIKNSNKSNNKNLKENGLKNLEQLNEFKIKFENLTNQLNEYKIENEKLTKQFNEKQNENEKLIKQLNDNKNEIEKLKNKLKEKENEKLNNQLNEKLKIENENEKIKIKLKEKENEIENLNNQLNKKQKIENENEKIILKEKENEIEKLNNQLKEKQNIIDDLKNNKNENFEEIKKKLEEEYKIKFNNLKEEMEKEILLKSNSEQNKSIEFKEKDNFDFILEIDNIENFLKGFKYYLSDNFTPFFYDPKNIMNPKFNQKAIQKSLFKIGLIGDIQVGKSFILSKILEKKIEDDFEGYKNLIKSLKLKLYNNDNYLFIEGIGLNMSYNYIKKEKKENQILIGQLNELFIKHFIYNVCDLIIIIVKELNQTDLERLENLKYFFNGKKIFILHNMKRFNLEEFNEYVDKTKKNDDLEKFEIVKFEGKGEGSYYIENSKDDDNDEDIRKTVFIKENKKKIEKKEIVHLFIGNDNVEEINKINKGIFEYIKTQITTSNLNTVKKSEDNFCFEKILKSNFLSFSKKFFLIKHIHKDNIFSTTSINKIDKNYIEINNKEKIIKYVIPKYGNDKVIIIPKNININFYTGGTISKDILNIENVSIYFHSKTFQIVFNKQSFMEIDTIKSTIETKNEEESDIITYFIKIEGDFKNIEKYNSNSNAFKQKFKEADFKLNDINKYKHFAINMKFQHNCEIIINKNVKPTIKEENETIAIIYNAEQTEEILEMSDYEDDDNFDDDDD